MKPHSLINSNLSVYLLAFFLGWAGYSLKLVSIVKLLGELDFKFYPLLMLIQGISLFATFKLMNKVSKNNEKQFHSITIFLGLILVFLTNTESLNQYALKLFGWYYSFIIFLISAYILLAIDITTRLIVTSKISMLENPKAASVVTFFGESGGLCGAIITLLLAQSMALMSSLVTPALMVAPFIMALIFLYLMDSNERKRLSAHHSPVIQNALEQHSKSLGKHLKLFLPILIGLVTVALLTKQFQGFAVIIGLKQWHESSNASIASIFSLLAIAQNSLILVVIIPYFFLKGKSTIWSNGFKILFATQSLSMLLLTILATPVSLLGTGVLRKIVQRSFVGKSMNMLISSIPESIRFEAKSQSQKYAHCIAYTVLALISYLAIFDYISYQIVWFLGFFVALSGFYLIKMLLKKLNRFHVENVLEFSRCPFNVYEAISSCYSLANRDAEKHFSKISNVISKKHSRSIFAKALIHTMGEMKNRQAVDYLFELFDIAKREDVQLEILKALNQFDGLKIDHFMLTVLKKTMYQDIQRGELRASFCRVISKRLPQASISVATQAIEENPNDSRVVGNAVDILGEISADRKTRKIQMYLCKFLSVEHSRRVRLNAIKHLFQFSKYRQQCVSILNQLETSSRLQDQAGAAYLYGVLQLSDGINFVRELNVLTQRRNSTVLLSLIRLGEPDAEFDFIHLLREANQQDSLNYLKQLNRVREDRSRYLVYSGILERYPENISHVLHAMRDSYKNFDEDRRVIIEEANRLGIAIQDDLLYLVQ